MSPLGWLVVGIGLAMLFAFVGLILLWAVTEELPNVARVPFYERLEPGRFGVRVIAVGRRRMRAMRVANEVLGGDLAAAKAIVDRPPALLIEGISGSVAWEIVAALEAAGATAEVVEAENQKVVGVVDDPL